MDIHGSPQFEDLGEPSGMIIMAMAQEDLANGSQVFIESEGVGHDRIATSGIEEIISLIRLDKCGKPVFSGTDTFAY